MAGCDRLCGLSGAPAPRARARPAISASASATASRAPAAARSNPAIVRIGRSGRISVYTGADADGAGDQDRARADLRRAVRRLAPTRSRSSPATPPSSPTARAASPAGRPSRPARRCISPPSPCARRRSRSPPICWRRRPTTSSCATAASRSPACREAGLRCARSPKRCPACPATRCRASSTPGLESMQNFLPSALTYGGGSHAVEVEVDVETGGVRILRYVVVNDSGRIINPMIAEGQIVGGVVHALGNALFEWMGYDDAGAADHHHVRRVSHPERDRGAENRGEVCRVSLPAQSAGRQGRRRIRLRAGRRRDRLGGRACAVAVRRADYRISDDAGKVVRADSIFKKLTLLQTPFGYRERSPLAVLEERVASIAANVAWLSSSRVFSLASMSVSLQPSANAFFWRSSGRAFFLLASASAASRSARHRPCERRSREEMETSAQPP